MNKLPFFLPFAACPGRCVYCNQTKITGQEKIPSAAFVCSVLKQQQEAKEVCFFGGSFLRFPFETVKAYLDTVKQFAPKGSTVRFSTYPNDLDDENICALLKKYSISKIELGIQSLDKAVLKNCKRDLDPAQILKSVEHASQHGFPLGVQLMIGLPGQTEESSLNDLNKLAEIKEDAVWDLRIYPCLVIEDTELAHMYRKGSYKPLTLNQAVHASGRLIVEAEKLGFNIIRIGLQESESLASAVIAGPHHPALGELALSCALVEKLTRLNPNGPWQLSKKDISKFCGHNGFGYKLLADATKKSFDEIKTLLIFD